MSNPLFNQMTGNGMLQQFQQFAQNFKGDPRQQIQQMLNSGRIVTICHGLRSREFPAPFCIYSWFVYKLH